VKLTTHLQLKNAWSYTSALPYVFMAWCLVKQRDNFTFYLTLFTGSKLFDDTVSTEDVILRGMRPTISFIEL